jgi:hypothetical protein
MLKNTIAGLVLINVETLQHYQTTRKDNPAVVDDISTFISKIINGLPWYYSFPSRMLLFITGSLCILTTGKSIKSLSRERRSVFLKYVKFIPLFATLNELVRALTFLRLFDVLPLVVDDEI